MNLDLSTELRSILEAVVNIKLSPESWRQTSLPVRWGGIGLRCPSTLAPSAYLASLHSSSTLISLLLPAHFPVHPDGLLTRATEKWISVSGSACPVGQEASRQRAWDDGICHALSSGLLRRLIGWLIMASHAAAVQVVTDDMLGRMMPFREPSAQPTPMLSSNLHVS